MHRFARIGQVSAIGILDEEPHAACGAVVARARKDLASGVRYRLPPAGSTVPAVNSCSIPPLMRQPEISTAEPVGFRSSMYSSSWLPLEAGVQSCQSRSVD